MQSERDGSQDLRAQGMHAATMPARAQEIKLEALLS